MKGYCRWIAMTVAALVALPAFAGGYRLGAPLPRVKAVGTQHLVATHQDIDMQASDHVTVRLQNPPVDYDDKGNPKKYTKEELKELKGPDPKLPGYTGDYSYLKKGQVITVYLS